MEKTINKDKLKIKYILDNYRDLPKFPTCEDILYELTKDFCTKSTNVLYFTNETLKNRYNLDNNKIELFVNKLIEKGIIKKEKEKENLITYSVIKNIFV